VKEGRERRGSVVFVEANDPKERKVRTITSMEGQGSVLPLRRANEIVRPALSLQKGRSATVRVLRFDVLPTLSDADTAVHAARDETEPMQKTRWRKTRESGGKGGYTAKSLLEGSTQRLLRRVAPRISRNGRGETRQEESRETASTKSNETMPRRNEAIPASSLLSPYSRPTLLSCTAHHSTCEEEGEDNRHAVAKPNLRPIPRRHRKSTTV
jgi:hypothetical protein